MHLNTHLTKGGDCMNSTVVKLDTLTDPDRTGTKDHDLLLF